jgi:hypothetical protein
MLEVRTYPQASRSVLNKKPLAPDSGSQRLLSLPNRFAQPLRTAFESNLESELQSKFDYARCPQRVNARADTDPVREMLRRTGAINGAARAS